MFFDVGGEKRNMNRKIKVLALISIVVAAAVGASMVMMLMATAKADTQSSVSQDAQPSLPSFNTTIGNGFSNSNTGGPRGMSGGFGGPGGFGGNNFLNGTDNTFGSIQVSSAYTQNVTNILNNSTDVQALFSQGWNVTSIKPVITTTIDGNGNVITQATTANVIIQGTNGRAFVVVDLTTQKVTKIVTTTVNNNPT